MYVVDYKWKVLPTVWASDGFNKRSSFHFAAGFTILMPCRMMLIAVVPYRFALPPLWSNRGVLSIDSAAAHCNRHSGALHDLPEPVSRLLWTCRQSRWTKLATHHARALGSHTHIGLMAHSIRKDFEDVRTASLYMQKIANSHKPVLKVQATLAGVDVLLHLFAWHPPLFTTWQRPDPE